MDDQNGPNNWPEVPLARPATGAVPFARPAETLHPLVAAMRRHEFYVLDLTRPAAWFDVGAGSAMLLALQGAALVLLGILVFAPTGIGAPDAPTPDALLPYLLAPSLVVQAVCAFAAVGVVLLYRQQSVRSVGIAWASLPLNVVIGLGAALVAYAIILPLMFALQFVFPEAARQMQENTDILLALLPDLPHMQFAGMAVVIGIWEELVFRGFLMTRLRRATGRWVWAVLISSIVFVLPHGLEQTPVALVMVSILSLVFSLVTIWRRSIIPAIVGHAAFNFSQFAGMLYMRENMAWL